MSILTPAQRIVRHIRPSASDLPCIPEPAVEVPTMGVAMKFLVCGNCLQFNDGYCRHTKLQRQDDNVACNEIHVYYRDFGFVEPPGRKSWAN